MRLRKKLLSVLSTVVLFVPGCGVPLTSEGHAQAPAPPPAPVAVTVATVERGEVARPIRATGVIRAKAEVNLAFLVGGKVTWVGPDVGARVRRGQVLARLDATAYDADVARARLAEQKADRDLARVEALRSTGSLPPREVEDATTGRDVATETLRAATFARAHAVLVAPADGLIEARVVEEGAIVGGGTPVFRLATTRGGSAVRASLTDRDVLDVRVGQRANVTLDASSARYDATVSEIATTASPATGTFEVELTLTDASVVLPNGLSVKAQIDRTVTVGALVPIEALVDGEGLSASVWVIASGRPRRVPVHVAFFEAGRAALVEDLSGAEHVATVGASSLLPNSRVEVTR
jgi:multidrug efflux system membrane fusion protein